MPDSNGHRKKAMIEAMEKSLGIVTSACKQVGISRDTHYRWLREDDEYRSNIANIDEMAIDYAEGQLFSQIKEGNVTAIIFYLKTKAKHRGYVEKQMVEIGEVSINLIDGTEGY